MKVKVNKQEFDEEVSKSINTSSQLIKGTHYFDEEYAHALGKYLGDNGEKLMNEFVDLGQGRTKICSVASSARLCALYFANGRVSDPTPNGEFEKCFPIKGVVGIPPHLDYYSADTNTCYECKCHEILDDHSSDKLKIKYKKAVTPLFMNKDFKYDNEFIYPTLEDLGMDDKELLSKLELKPTDSIYCLHFNVKQLLTHLMGLLSSNPVNIKLQYVFFYPVCGHTTWGRSLYETLENEIKLIMKSYTLYCAANHGVIFLDPVYVEVGSIHDYALDLTRDEDRCHDTPQFLELFNKYSRRDDIPSLYEITHDNKVDYNFATRLTYNLLLYRSKNYKFDLAFPIIYKPEDMLTDSKVHNHTDIVQQSFCDYYQVCDPIAKEAYEKFLELRENKEALEVKGIK
ncbi:MAG: hypothetical protein MJ213_04480 [Bacilli bacterium]|nr:hypothetical protein [Bacilli bacterium]